MLGKEQLDNQLLNEAELPLGSFISRIRRKFGKTHCKITLNYEILPKIGVVAALIGKIATSSPVARFKDSRAALGPAANLTLEHIGLNLSQTAKIS